MFQTDIILFIQSFASDFWTVFFKFWSAIGSAPGIIFITLIILFGINFRSGFILAHIVLWNGIITFSLKEIFALPRPANVDRNVKLLGESYPNPTHFESMGAKSFFGGPPADVVESLRISPIDSWGFPSGHTSSAIALWGSIIIFFKKVGIWMIAAAMIVFIPFSRMYLGRHFLADVLGGYFLGFVVMFIFCNVIYKNGWLKTFLFGNSDQIRWDLKSFFFLLYFLFLPLLLLLLPNIFREGIASLIGLNMGFLLLRIRGIPKDSGTVIQRISRVLIAIVFYLGAGQLLKKLSDVIFRSEPGAVEFVRIALTMIFIIWISTELSIKLGFFRRDTEF